MNNKVINYCIKEHSSLLEVVICINKVEARSAHAVVQYELIMNFFQQWNAQPQRQERFFFVSEILLCICAEFFVIFVSIKKQLIYFSDICFLQPSFYLFFGSSFLLSILGFPVLKWPVIFIFFHPRIF